jgi:ribosomal protein S5
MAAGIADVGADPSGSKDPVDLVAVALAGLLDQQL